MEEELQKEISRSRCAKIEEKPDKEVQMEVMVAVGEGMENGDVRGIKMVTKEVDEEIWTIAMRI